MLARNIPNHAPAPQAFGLSCSQASARISLVLSSVLCCKRNELLMRGYQLTVRSAYNCLVLYVCGARNLRVRYYMMGGNGTEREPNKPRETKYPQKTL